MKKNYYKAPISIISMGVVALVAALIYYSQNAATPGTKLSRTNAALVRSLEKKSTPEILQSIDDDLASLDSEYNFDAAIQTHDLIAPDFARELTPSGL